MRPRNFSSTKSQLEKSYTEHLDSLHRAGVRFGQPTQFTHPHMLKPNELAIGLLPNEFAERRHQFMEKIKAHCLERQKPNHNIVILTDFHTKLQNSFSFLRLTTFYFNSGYYSCLDEEIYDR